MVECLAKIAACVDELPEKHLTTVGEIYKAFSVLFGSLAEDLRMYFCDACLNGYSCMYTGPRALGVLMPPMILLLDPGRTPPSAFHAQSVAQLLSFAASSPTAFKEATSKLDPQMRESLESSVRQALGNKALTSEAPKPQISLRSF